MRFQEEDNTFYFYTNHSNVFSDDKQARINELQKEVSGLGPHNFNIINDTFNAESRISVISKSTPRALTKVFEIYSAISKEEFDKNVKDLSPICVIIWIETKYLNIKFLFGSSLGIRRQDIFAVEIIIIIIIIEKENGDQLLNFGLMILKLFPNSL